MRSNLASETKATTDAKNHLNGWNVRREPQDEYETKGTAIDI